MRKAGHILQIVKHSQGSRFSMDTVYFNNR